MPLNLPAVPPNLPAVPLNLPAVPLNLPALLQRAPPRPAPLPPLKTAPFPLKRPVPPQRLNGESRKSRLRAAASAERTSRGGVSAPSLPEGGPANGASQAKSRRGCPCRGTRGRDAPSPCRTSPSPCRYSGGSLLPSGKVMSVFGRAARSSRSAAAGIFSQPRRLRSCRPVRPLRASTFCSAVQ